MGSQCGSNVPARSSRHLGSHAAHLKANLIVKIFVRAVIHCWQPGGKSLAAPGFSNVTASVGGPWMARGKIRIYGVASAGVGWHVGQTVFQTRSEGFEN